MLAIHAGVNPEDLDSMFDISMEDAFPDRHSLVLHLLSLSMTCNITMFAFFSLFFENCKWSNDF